MKKEGGFFSKTPYTMIPGPVQLRREVLDELGTQVVPHYGDEWTAFFERVTAQLGEVFQTDGKVFLIPGSGSAGLDAAIGSAVGPSDRVLILSNGFFGERLAEIARTHSTSTDVIRLPVDRPIKPDSLRKTLKKIPDVALVAAVHCESSSGLLNPIRDLAEICQQHGVLFLADAISSLGGIELRMDEWGIGACVTASQKCLEGPPGLGLVAIGKDAWAARYSGRRSRGWYLNLGIWNRYQEKWSNWHPHPVTMPVQVVRALHRGVEYVLEEGFERRWKRHAAFAGRARQELAKLGFNPLFPEEWASPTVLSALGRPDLTTDVVIADLVEHHGIQISGGMGPFAGKVFRIGNMGPQASESGFAPLRAALREIVARRGARGIARGLL